MKQKNIYRAGLICMILLLLSLALLVSCTDKKPSNTEIFIQSSDSPKLTYVQGQELDLSHGVLTVAEDGEQRSLPLDNGEISVTGYDKNTLGKQTLTVTYKGFTTTFDITVIPRMTAENYESDYFIGDVFDSSKGRLRIAKDDGSTFNVNLNSEKVSLVAFNPNQEGDATVTVAYREGETSYECSFTVKVHKPAKVTLTPPKKTQYVSHETELALSGGYLTVEAAAPSTFSKYVPLTADMISGYDPAKVTIADRNAPVTQVLTISYAGQSFEFSVEISYSSVYLVESVGRDLAHLDWTGETLPDYTDEQGELALDALRAYLTLSPADRDLIDKETLMAVVRPATVTLNTAYYESSLVFADAFTITPEGYINIVGESYEAVEKALAHLNDPLDEFNTIAAELCELKELFADEIIVGTTTFTNGITAHTAESLEQMTPIFEYMLSIFDALKEVPDDWTLDSLSDYETPITTAVSKIQISNYVGLNYNQFYDVISSWRAKDDYFDIIYSYYYYIKDNGQSEILSSLWQKLPGPGVMNDWYMAYIRALTEAGNMEKYGSDQGFLYDTTGLMYYYAEANRLAAEVKASNNDLYLGLFKLLEAEEAMDIHLKRSTCGYIAQMGEALGMASIEHMWEVYLKLVDAYLNHSPDVLLTEFSAEFEAVFQTMAALPTAELYTFISTVNFLYDTARGEVLVLDCSERPYNTLTFLLCTYYRELLPSAELDGMFLDLLIAMENVSLLGVKASALGDFQTVMGKLEASYGKLSREDKTLFDQHFGSCYAKYQTILANATSSSVTLPNSWEEKFNELVALLDAYDMVYSHMSSPKTTNEERSRVTPLLFALYEKAYRLYSEIAYSNDLTATSALATKAYRLSDVSYTLDRRFIGARGMFITLTITSGIEDLSGNAQLTWDVYNQAALQPFLADIAYLMLDEHNGKAYRGDDLAALMASFRALPTEQKIYTYKLGINLLYYAAIERTYSAQLGEEAGKIVSLILQAEIAYSMYEYDQSDASLKDFNAKMAEAAKLYENLEDKAAFDKALGDTYAYYKELYKA